MSRNPHATNLRHHKPKRIEDKRDVRVKDMTRSELQGWLRSIAAMDDE